MESGSGRALPCVAVPGLQDTSPGTPGPARSGDRFGDGQALGFYRGPLALSSLPSAVPEQGLCSDRPGDGDSLGRDSGTKGSLRGTGILGHPRNSAGSGWEL